MKTLEVVLAVMMLVPATNMALPESAVNSVDLTDAVGGDSYDNCWVDAEYPVACPPSGITWITCSAVSCGYRQGNYACQHATGSLESAGGASGYYDDCDTAAGEGNYQCSSTDIWCYLSKDCFCDTFTGLPQKCHAQTLGVSKHVKKSDHFADGEACLN